MMSSLLLSIFRAFVDFKVEVIVMAHISLFFIVQTFDFIVVVVTMVTMVTMVIVMAHISLFSIFQTIDFVVAVVTMAERY